MTWYWQWGYGSCLLVYCRLAWAVDQVPVKLDLWDAPWKNMVVAIMTSLLGGCWAFLNRVAKDEIPTGKMLVNLLRDLLASVVVGLAILFFADSQSWTYGQTMLTLLGGGIGASLIVELWRQKGLSFSKLKD